MTRIRRGHALEFGPLASLRVTAVLASLTSAALAVLALAGCAGGGAGKAEPEGGIVGNGWVDVTPKPEGDGPVITILGTVRHLDLEGGLFVVQDAGGTNYNPTNLPGEFRKDGKVVEAEARERKDVGSIGMVGPVIDVVRIRERSVTPLKAEREALAGTKWRLVDLAGQPAASGVEATLEFGDDGSVSGNASCNNFRGTATVSGDAITFGPLATTRKMCDEVVMTQETAYLAALGEALRYEMKGRELLLHMSGGPAPLRLSPR
ncbi:MAG TPA: META domain-containing protein [Gemmatimonadales bacterium]|nr:META domain-containing protein [Gemmatimonadales bacterium]